MAQGVCRGVWKREWEEDPIGDAEGADRDTLVLWTQSSTSGIYVDLRLPSDSPGRSFSAAQALGIVPRPSAIAANGCFRHHVANVSPDVVNILSRQKSFAGLLGCKPGDTTAGQALKQDLILADLAQKAESSESALKLCTCFWLRDLDYQPPTGGLDVGVCASEPQREDGSIFMRETGEDASYAEGWLRLPGTDKGPFAALELLSENDIVGARKGYWVRAGNRFAYAVGRPTTSESAAALGCGTKSHELASCVGKALVDAVSSLATDQNEMLNLVMSYVAVAGEIESGQWKICHSTNPELVGCLLIGKDRDDLCCSTLSGNVTLGEEIDQILTCQGGSLPFKRKWKVVELQDGSIP